MTENLFELSAMIFNLVMGTDSRQIWDTNEVMEFINVQIRRRKENILQDRLLNSAAYN